MVLNKIPIVLAFINQWHTRQVEFIIAYLQYNINHNLYTKQPKGIKANIWNEKTQVLKLISNMYRQNKLGTFCTKYYKD